MVAVDDGLTAPVHFRRKPRPVSDDGVVAAKYKTGAPLGAVAQVADMAYHGEVAECTLPSGVTVLLARWRNVPDNGPSHWDYTVVHDGKWLYYSEGYGRLGEDTDGGLAQWYEPEVTRP